jgi:hypothetical protein
VSAQREVDRDAAVLVLQPGDDVTPQVVIGERAGEELASGLAGHVWFLVFVVQVWLRTG